MRRITRTGLVTAGVVLLCCGFSGTALAEQLQTEDFDLLPAGGFNNSFFNHDLGAYEFGASGPPDQSFPTITVVSSPFAYNPVAATDFVSFNLAEGDFVDRAQVWMRTSSGVFGVSTFHVIGLDAAGDRLDMIVDSPPSPDGVNRWIFVDTSAEPFASISGIRLSGLDKGLFDDLAVNVVPEPATCMMLGVGLGGLFLARRRRRNA